MYISYNWLKSYMKNADTAMPTPETVSDLFTMRAFEVESMEEQDGDVVYDIKLTADRSPYARGIRYIALELSLLVPELIFDPKFTPFTKTNIDTTTVKTEVHSALVDKHATALCPMYSLTKIENVHNGVSPSSVIEKLKALGQQSRGTIVDLTNLVMYDTGQPLHAFDADKVEGDVLVAVLDVDTEVSILGGKKVSLKKGMLVIRDDKDILAIAGVKGCVKAEVTADTKNIFLESATFERVGVRKTSRTLDIINDSSKCFEQGVSGERFLLGVETYIEHIKNVFPDAKVQTTQVSTDVDAAISSVKLNTILVSVEKMAKLVNPEDKALEQEFKNFLEQTLPKTGAVVEKKSMDEYVITAPLYRTDLQTEADVVDEFIRNVGYEIITYKKTEEGGETEQGRKYVVLKAIRKFLTEKGFTEVLLHTLVDNNKNPDAVLLENALTSERNALRAFLAPEMEHAIVKNFPYLDIVEKTSVNLFEIGYVYEVVKNSIKQKLHLALGIGMPKQLKKKGNTESLTEITHELFLGLNSVKNRDTETVYITEVDITDFVETSDLKVNETKKEYLSPNARIKSFPYKKASVYPSMSRDIAFFVEGGDKADVDQSIRAFAKQDGLIETITLFDEFTKEDKTSYGYRFVFQSYEKTLTEEEVSKSMQQIAESVTEKGWIVR